MNRTFISQLRGRVQTAAQQSPALSWLAAGVWLNVFAPFYVANRLWGRRYTLKQVEVIEGATFDPLSPTWHTISFQAMLEGTPVSYELVLDRAELTLEVERPDPNSPDLFELPFVLVDETDIAILGVGALPAAFTAVIGSPVYAARRAYFAMKAKQASRLGLAPEAHALYEALAPHLSTKVAELLLDVLRKTRGQPNQFSIDITHFSDLRCLLRQADRFEASSADHGHHSYRWELNGLEVAYAEPIMSPNGEPRYQISLSPHLTSAAENLERFSAEEVAELLWCYKNTRRE